MKILAISPSWIGDTMMSHSLYRTLKLLYPKAIIDVISPIYCLPLLLCMKEVNMVIPMPVEHGALKIGIRHKLGRSLRSKFYDHAYILPNSFKSALVPFFAKVPRRTGWCGEMRYGLLNDMRVLNNEEAWPLIVERYIALAYDKTIIRNSKDLPQPLLWPKLHINDNAKFHTCNTFRISSARPMIGLCPGSESGLAKCWPHYRYAELAKKLVEQGFQLIIFGSIKDEKIGKSIFDSLSNMQKKLCCNFVGKTQLQQAIILIACCKVIVTNDSGLMHIAAALNCPLIALYGPSNPNFTPPLSRKARVIHLMTDYQKIHKKNTAEGYHQGLIDITAQQVFQEIIELLLSEEKYRCDY